MVRRFSAVLGLILAAASTAYAGALSTSILNPTALDASGVVDAAFPEGKTAYYVAADVKPGDLMAQISFDGRQGAQKAIDLALLDANARSSGSFWLQGQDAGEEKTRRFAIDSSGKQIVRLEVEGPPTARFRVELGGSALANAAPKAAPAAGQLSRSIFQPTPLANSGVVSGALPGDDKRVTYYVAVDVQKGDLLTQISVASRQGADKSLDFSLLGDDGAPADTYWVHGEGSAEEKTRSFPIDSAGKRIVKLAVQGPASGTFKVELGGTAVAERPPATDGAARTAQASPQ